MTAAPSDNELRQPAPPSGSPLIPSSGGNLQQPGRDKPADNVPQPGRDKPADNVLQPGRDKPMGNVTQTGRDRFPILDTQAMMSRLKGNEFPEGDWSNFLETDIRDFFDELFLATGHSRSVVIRDANISRTYGYQIMDGTRIGKRDYYLSIAIAMHLDFRTTQRMLAVTASGALHALIKRDAAIIFAINHGYDSYRLYQFLTELGLPPLDTGVEAAT